MKKVFSIEKFVADCIADGDGVDYDDVIDRHSWALSINGLTEEEIEAMDYGTCDEWMVEVEDTEEVNNDMLVFINQGGTADVCRTSQACT